MTILLVEDHLNILKNKSQILVDKGHEVYRCGSIEIADQLLDEYKEEIDCIITDLNMNPKGLSDDEIKRTKGTRLSGWVWLLKYVRVQGGAGKRIKVVICSEFINILEDHISGCTDINEISVFKSVVIVKKNSTVGDNTALLNAINHPAGCSWLDDGHMEV